MTPKQWKILEILEHWDGEGTAEVEIQWGGYDYGDTEAEEAKAFRVNRLVVAALVRSLVKKGYARDDADGYGITDAGRALLAKRSRRVAR
jgi:DNA-binding MarR family transcriptional regulator